MPKTRFGATIEDLSEQARALQAERRTSSPFSTRSDYPKSRRPLPGASGPALHQGDHPRHPGVRVNAIASRAPGVVLRGSGGPGSRPPRIGHLGDRPGRAAAPVGVGLVRSLTGALRAGLRQR